MELDKGLSHSWFCEEYEAMILSWFEKERKEKRD